MNRKIKFRIWNGERFYYSRNFENINFRTSGDVFRVWLNGDDPNNANRYILIDSEKPLEQYTGLHDKNGKEIYEGDIVEVWEHGYENEKTHGKIVYFAHQDYPAFDIFPTIDCDSNALSNYLACGKIEVIGNIHETPSLTAGNR